MSTRHTVPAMFYDDHADRDLPAGVVIKRTRRAVTVELDNDSLAELLSDALHYSDASMFEPEFRGLCASARATVRALRP